MDLKEIKRIAKLFDMIADYESIPDVVDYLINDCGFTEKDIMKLSQEIMERIDLFLFELTVNTTKPKRTNL